MSYESACKTSNPCMVITISKKQRKEKEEKAKISARKLKYSRTTV